MAGKLTGGDFLVLTSFSLPTSHLLVSTLYACITSVHRTFLQRRLNVEATSWARALERHIDFNATLYTRHVPAGVIYK